MFDSGPYAAVYNRPALNRLNERHKRIIVANADHIRGKRVLDLAAHDGRWTWAALSAGASYVEAVEGRPELVAAGRKLLSSFPEETWRFEAGDIFPYLEAISGTFDTVLCLGIFYHISEHMRLLNLMAQVRPSAIIIDSALMTTDAPIIQFRSEETGNKLHVIPGEPSRTAELVGTASKGLMAVWAKMYGWKVTYISWNPRDIDDLTSLNDYLTTDKPRARFTCMLTRQTA